MAMKAEIKEILNRDNWLDLKDYQPDNLHYFHIDISMTIGIQGQKDGDYFTTQICSFAWFHQLVDDEKRLLNQNLIIVEYYDYSIIIEQLNHIIMKYDEPDWHSLAIQLNQHFDWEFDNYVDRF